MKGEASAGGGAARGTSMTVGQTFAHAVRYWRPHWRVALVLIGFLAVPQAYKAFFAFSQRLIVDQGLLAHDAALLGRVVAALALGFLLAGAASVADDYLAAKVSAAIVNRLREQMFAHLQRLSIGYYGRTRTGDIVARFTSDLADIQKSLTTRIVDAVFALLGLAINVPVAFALEWRLATVMVAGMPVAMVGTRLFGRRAAQARYALKTEEATVASVVQESVRAQPVVKVFRLQGWSKARFGDLLEDVRRRLVRAEFLSELVGSSSSLGVLAVQVLVLAAGAWLAFNGQLTAGTLVAFISLHALVSKDAYDLTKKVIPSLIASSGGLARIEELLGEPEEVADEANAMPLPPVQGPLRLEHVTFAYGDGRRALEDISIEAGAGERLALVGPSGSGKSTVLQLLLRFYDPLGGRVTADGRDLRRVTLESWHSQTAAVFQESFLFAGTIGENIAVGKPDASPAEVEAAARAAEIHDVIAALPEGYDTPVGEAGGRLSGGQRQRVAIARAILRDPAVLFLDEATSALDPATEAAVNATLDRLSRGRIVITVTHRLASARDADRIIVLDEGRVAENGSHAELLAADGLYRRMWEKQNSVTVSDDGRDARVEAGRLAAVPLLAPLTPDQREHLARRMTAVRFEKGQTIVREGEAADRFFVVARGRVEVTVAAGEAERRLAVLSDGDFFGETALISDQPRSATVRAVEPSTLLTLAAADLRTLLAAHPEVRQAVEREARRRSERTLDPLATVSLSAAPRERGPGET